MTSTGDHTTYYYSVLLDEIDISAAYTNKMQVISIRDLGWTIIEVRTAGKISKEKERKIKKKTT